MEAWLVVLTSQSTVAACTNASACSMDTGNIKRTSGVLESIQDGNSQVGLCVIRFRSKACDASLVPIQGT